MDVGNIAGLSAFKSASRSDPALPATPAAGRQEGEGEPTERSDSRARLDAAVSDIQKHVQGVRRNLNFSIDDTTGDVVVKVIDGDSGKVVRQIPSEEVLKLAARLDDMRSLMFEAQA
ncbi:flagellar protein FlaG [Pseudomonas sp. ZM23]|uniref:Flagellar protein FlaG n=1 Tax=Pseudomonas triclosanedens TaxID=2961893 RepID=A0ABY7A2T1_9PSED|nr:flagellar protein FlaG [Pseudomonas triclosanedens]MCP8464855.1 flagellar protein FlaG [Pseudomonas triclosanedens]MCP8470432.1 flagellar protein FlaG [Pseudomonas triclosanedens]MCP8476238.1 flagellar protein FlaG [Pseudomonas triclosanedens]WAI51529.1 flagellar protein FlaG [Pseudomonas triclosanedens]